MNLRETFNEDACNYDKFRPLYIPDLFNDIIRYSKIDNKSTALEIGIGTGQATTPILETGCKVTAIELGKNLAEFSKQKFSAYRNFSIMNANFEDYEDELPYDLIYSATAFHWIPQDFGFQKVFQMLKTNGTLSLFWNHPSINCSNDKLHTKIREVYYKYCPSDNNNVAVQFDDSECQKYCDVLNKYGFVNSTYKIYKHTRQLTAKEYISLLNTYSNHRALPFEIKTKIEQEIEQEIINFGNVLRIYDTMDLYLAKKA